MPTVDDYIKYAASGVTEMVTTSCSGLEYVVHGGGKQGFLIPGAWGNVDKVAQNIVDRYKDGIMLDTFGQVSNICNWAHKQDVPAVDVLRRVDELIADLGAKATEYQTRTRGNVRAALAQLS